MEIRINVTAKRDIELQVLKDGCTVTVNISPHKVETLILSLKAALDLIDIMDESIAQEVGQFIETAPIPVVHPDDIADYLEIYLDDIRRNEAKVEELQDTIRYWKSLIDFHTNRFDSPHIKRTDSGSLY